MVDTPEAGPRFDLGLFQRVATGFCVEIGNPLLLADLILVDLEQGGVLARPDLEVCQCRHGIGS